MLEHKHGNCAHVRKFCVRGGLEPHGSARMRTISAHALILQRLPCAMAVHEGFWVVLFPVLACAWKAC